MRMMILVNMTKDDNDDNDADDGDETKLMSSIE